MAFESIFYSLMIALTLNRVVDFVLLETPSEGSRFSQVFDSESYGARSKMKLTRPSAAVTPEDGQSWKAAANQDAQGRRSGRVIRDKLGRIGIRPIWGNKSHDNSPNKEEYKKKRLITRLLRNHRKNRASDSLRNNIAISDTSLTDEQIKRIEDYKRSNNIIQ